MELNTFSERLKDAMQNKQMKQVDLIKAAQNKGVKLGKSHISQYVSGKTIPRADMLHFLAETLEVDEKWLMGNSDSDNKEDVKVIENKENVNLGGSKKMRNFKEIAILPNQRINIIL